MKKYLLFAIFMVANHISNGQVAVFGNKYEVYAYGGVSRVFCDVNTVNYTGSGGIGGGMKLHKYFTLNLDIQHGLYKGGNKNDRGQYYMEFSNNYTSTSLMAKFYPFIIPFNKLDALDRFYVSAGLGLHFNNVKAYSSNVIGVGFLGNNKNIDFFIPMEVGYSFPVYTWVSQTSEIPSKTLNVIMGLRYNLSFSDAWDGYNPTVSANKFNDASSTFFVGMSYKFN